MKDVAELFIDSRCELGEGALWHPGLKRLFWFDIPNQTLFSATTNGIIIDRFTFEAPVSAAAIINNDNLAIAAAGGLFQLEISSDTRSLISPLELNKPGNRSNDGRADRAGGFWIGTMSRNGDHEPGAGAIYQYRMGTLTTVLESITIPNSICFSPDGGTAYCADTPTGMIRQCAINVATGLPSGEWRDFAKSDGNGLPDGAVVDSEGFVWSARWRGSSVVRYAPDGSIDRVVKVPVSQVTCPAFGGDDLKTLYITSGREDMTHEDLEREPYAGSVFSIALDVPGLPEPRAKV